MPVLVEALSVVVRKDAIHRAFTGGWPWFEAIVPNRTLCSDKDLAAVSLLLPDAVGEFVKVLEKHGLSHIHNGLARNLT